MIVRGLLMLEPERPPRLGWVSVRAGRIAEVGEGEPARGAGESVIGGADRLVCPAFIDAHVHLPQVDAVGCLGPPLLPWLERVVFPAEQWWGAGGARRTLEVAVERLVRQGTLGFAGYLTSHGEANAEAARRLASGVGLPGRVRAAVGRVAMDRSAPDELTAEDHWRAKQTPTPSIALPEPEPNLRERRVEISVNPRFAIACSDELLAEAGWLVRDRMASGSPILVQTHLGESIAERDRVRELFPIDANYAAVYDRHGLLTERTLLAHCVHLDEAEWRLVAERQSVVVHCPSANLFLESGLFDLAAAKQRGVRLALGSDVAAGADFAMPRVARAMIETAQARRILTGEGATPSPAEAWRMITAGNADAIGWRDAGRIEPGCAADLLVLRVPRVWLDEHLVGRLLYNWDASLIEDRIIAGVRAPAVD